MNYYAPRSLLTALLVGFALPAMLWATPIFDPGTSTCTGVNCSSVRIDGVVRETTGEVRPWVIELFANPGTCLRAHVTAEGADLKAVLIAPNGNVYRNDDSGLSSCPNCPLIKVDPTPGSDQGFYTLQLSHWLGVPVTANFTLLYGLYPSGNPNCASPIQPFGAETAEPEVEKSDIEGPQPPIPGGPSQ
jgi:hypothetical protein